MKMEPGAKVQVKTSKGVFKGVLMPRTELSDKDHIVIKLSNGYNIGISKDDIKEIKEIVEKKEWRRPKKAKFDLSKPAISMVSTGGTITSKVDYKTGGVFPYTKPEELLADVPELGDFVNIRHIHSPFQLLSEDMSSEEWVKIAEQVYKDLNSSDIEGVIVTHGTDTLHYTAAALSFMLRNLNKPVALVGAQRSPDRGSFDGVLNIVCGAHYCLGDIAEVAVVMHASTEDKYCLAIRGTKVRKMHSSRRDAFRPINDFPLAKIWPDGNIIIENPNHRIRSSSKVELDTKFEEKVALIYSYPGSDPKIFEYCLDEGYRGIILAGTGFGHVSTQPLNKKYSWLPVIRSAIDRGMFIGMATQTLYGTTNPYVYSAGRLLMDAGVLYLKDMLPETAYVKLGWVLGHTKNLEKAREMMLTNYANEFNERVGPKTFLY